MTAQRTVALDSIALHSPDPNESDQEPVLRVSGTGPAPESIELVGSRLRIVGTVEPRSEG